MAGNIADKARWALREYDVRRGGGCDWYVKGYDGVEHKFCSCVYEHGSANSPAKVVRVLVEAVHAAGIRPKSWVAPITSLEKFEGELHETPKDYREAKEEYIEAVEASLITKPEVGKVSGFLLLIGALAVLWFMLFTNIRRG
jgi:hypothetical protein